MCFRIDCEEEDRGTVLRIAGQLVGWEAERVLREQIVRAAAGPQRIVVDVGEVTAVDSGCLAALETGMGEGLLIEGGGAYLKTLLRR
jgi:ABC-type transporter Mla MlaB component